MATLAAPQISECNGRADTDVLQPKRPWKPFALEKIIIFGSADERNLALRLQRTIENTEFIFFPPPVRMPGLGLKKAFRMNNGWKNCPSSSEKCEIPLLPSHVSPGNQPVCTISTGL